MVQKAPSIDAPSVQGGGGQHRESRFNLGYGPSFQSGYNKLFTQVKLIYYMFIDGKFILKEFYYLSHSDIFAMKRIFKYLILL